MARPLPGTTPGLIVHPDRGCSRQGGQYVGNAHKTLLLGAKAQLSHSWRGECDDNTLPGTTQAESRWSRLKTEALEARDWSVFSDLADAQVSIAEYFDYYNHDRCHSSIGY